MSLPYPVPHLVRLGNIKPTPAVVRMGRAGQPLDFTNGVDASKLPRELLDLAAQQGYAPAELMALALHGKGSVTPHTDGIFSDVTLLWLVADSALSYLMIAAGGKNGVMALKVGDVVLFPCSEYHAWVSRSSWVMFAIDVTTDRAEQAEQWRLPEKSPARCSGLEHQVEKT